MRGPPHRWREGPRGAGGGGAGAAEAGEGEAGLRAAMAAPVASAKPPGPGDAGAVAVAVGGGGGGGGEGVRRRLVAGGGGGKQGEASLDDEVAALRELAAAVARGQPRRSAGLMWAQTIIGALGLAVLVSIAGGGIIMLGQLNEEIGSLVAIQDDIKSVAESAKSLDQIRYEIGNMTDSIVGMGDDLSKLSNIGNQIGDAFGSGVSSTMGGLLENGLSSITDALGGFGGDSESGSRVEPVAMRLDPFGGCDPDTLQGAALVECLENPPNPNATIPVDTPVQGGGGRWDRLVEGLVGGLTRAAGVGLERVADAVLPESMYDPDNSRDRAGAGAGAGGDARVIEEEERL